MGFEKHTIVALFVFIRQSYMSGCTLKFKLYPKTFTELDRKILNYISHLVATRFKQLTEETVGNLYLS